MGWDFLIDEDCDIEYNQHEIKRLNQVFSGNDVFMMLTEQSNPSSARIDQVSTLELVRIINDEDAKIAAVMRQSLPDIAQAIDAIVAGIQQGGRLIYVGAGTSGRLGVLDAVECVPTYNVPPELVCALIAGGEKAITHSVEGAEDHAEIGRADLLGLSLNAQDVVVGIAASGRTPYVLGAVEAANAIGAVTVGISCNAPAALLDAAKIKIALPVGPEVIAGSTRMKAGTAQKLALNMLSTGSMIRLGKVYGNRMVDVQAGNEKLVGRAIGLVADIAGVSEDEAARLLEAAQYEVKTAIVMSRRSTMPEEARALLSAADGRLREVIG